jgi:hypothetical protein
LMVVPTGFKKLFYSGKFCAIWAIRSGIGIDFPIAWLKNRSDENEK